MCGGQDGAPRGRTTQAGPHVIDLLILVFFYFFSCHFDPPRGLSGRAGNLVLLNLSITLHRRARGEKQRILFTKTDVTLRRVSASY